MHCLPTCCEGFNGSCSRAWVWAAIFSVAMEIKLMFKKVKGSIFQIINRQRQRKILKYTRHKKSTKAGLCLSFFVFNSEVTGS